MSFEQTDIDKDDCITRTDYTGFLNRVSFEQGRCVMVFVPYAVVLELDAKDLIFVEFDKPKFIQEEVPKDEMDEIDELKIEKDCLLAFNALEEIPSKFEADRVRKWRGVPDARYFQEVVASRYREDNRHQSEIRGLQKRIRRASSYLQKAIDRAERRAEFNPEADMSHELSALKGALTFLEKDE